MSKQTNTNPQKPKPQQNPKHGPPLLPSLGVNLSITMEKKLINNLCLH